MEVSESRENFMTASGLSASVEDAEPILADWYENHYSDVTVSARGSFVESYMHRALERAFGPDDRFARVIEIGGNRGEHVPYVRHDFSEYLLTDLHEPKPSPELLADPRVKTGICDVSAIPHPDATFDRVVSTCVLHHVDCPLVAAQEMRRVTRPGGVISILVPTDPGLAYRVGKALTSARAAKRAGLGERYRLVVALDHRNHFWGIREQLRHAFRRDSMSIRWLPFRVPVVGINAFTVVTVRKSAA